MLTREQMAMRVAQELRDGDYVNLGIGIPTLVANYIPAGIEVMLQSENGLLGMGGAMDLVAGAQNIIVVMTHASKNGESKLLPQCTLPLTGVGCIRRVLTDLALLEIVDGAFVLREVAPGVSPDEVIRKTAGRLIVADDVREMRFS
ncbi:CoA-transferase [Klebsiella pneumoniae]